jgi:hypothetical protein
MDMEHFDIAHYTGHKALDELYKAYFLYVNSIEEVLYNCNIQTTRMDFKTISDIDTILQTTSITNLKIDAIDYINCFHIGGSLRMLRKKEAEFCINTAIFFQSMMEASINHLISLYSISFQGNKSPSFKVKWEKFLEINNAPETIKNSFKLYLDNIYKGIRIPAIHPDRRMGLENPELLRFPIVHENIMHGWFVFVFALSIEHSTLINYEDNWNTMCEEIHQIPSLINKEHFPDIEHLSNEMYKKHIDTLNNERN